MLYQGNNKFLLDISGEFLPTFVTDSNGDNILNTMLRFFICYKYKDNVEIYANNELKNKFYFNEFYSDPFSYDNECFNNIKGFDESIIVVFESAPATDLAKKGFIEVSESSCINQYLTSNSKIKTRIFINEEHHSLVAYTEKVATELWYVCLFSAMTKIWTWLFDKEDDKILELAKALGKKDFTKFDEIINGYFPENIAEQVNKNRLCNYSKSIINDEIQELQQEIQCSNRDIEDYYQKLKSRLEIRNRQTLQLEAYKELQSKTSKDYSLYDFFNHRQNITIKKVDLHYHRLAYSIQDTIEYYDVDELKRNLDNENSVIGKAPDWIKLLFKSLFVDDRGKFISQSVFVMEKYSAITPKRYGDYITYDTDTYLPHPHLGFYNCLGGNELEISNYLKSGDWQMAVDQTIAATKNINFGDSTVIGRLCGYLETERNKKFILADNGQRMTIDEFLTYINVENKEGENNE